MAERKCDYPPLVVRSNNRAPCPDNLYKAYKLKHNCPGCSKVGSLEHLRARGPTNLGDQVARQIVRAQMYKE